MTSTAAASVALAAREITVKAGARTLVDGVTLDVQAGEFLTLVGPNGAGKSTLAAVLAGDRTPDAGEVHLEGAPLCSLTRREVARRRAMLPQDSRVTFPFRTEQIVMMGRHPRLRRGHLPGPTDREAVARALAATDTGHLVGRAAPTLSAGELARVCLARVLAQDTEVVILDEPSASLDLQHQQRVLELCQTLADEGRAVLAIIHDLTQASAADRVLVMQDGRLVAAGPPDEVLTEGKVSSVFGVDVTILAHPTDHRPVILPK